MRYFKKKVTYIGNSKWIISFPIVNILQIMIDYNFYLKQICHKI